MSIDQDRERLSQEHNLEWIRCNLKATEMVLPCTWCPQESINNTFAKKKLNK